MTDSNTYTYDAFGATKTHTGTSASVWKFTGEQNDVTVNQAPYYLRARYYDPALGRFISRDPWPGLSNAPQSLDRYTYVAANPVLYTDPAGLWCPWNPEDCPFPEPLNTALKVTIPAWKIEGSVLNELLGWGIRKTSGGNCNTEGGITILQNCTGLCKLLSNLFGGQSFTVGHYIFSPGSKLEGDLKKHEMAHVKQYEDRGGLFLPEYVRDLVPALISCVGRSEPDCVLKHHAMEQQADQMAGTQIH